MSKAPAPLAVKERAPEIEQDTTESAVTAVTAVTASNGAGFTVTSDDAAAVTAVTDDDNPPPWDNGPEQTEPVEDAGEDAPSPFPPAKERPAYVVLDGWADEGKRRWPPGTYLCTVDEPKGAPAPVAVNIRICSPLHIDAVTHDAHGGEFGRLLRFKPTRGDWRTWAMPMELLAGSGEEMRRELLRQGVEIDPKHRQELALYLQARPPKKQIQCATQTGWAGDSFVLPDAVIGPSAQRITFQSAEHSNNEYVTGGTLDGWREGVAALASGNPVLLAAISAAFAGPLLKLCHAESGGLHLVGDSSTGKTTAIAAAASVYGPEAYRRSWRTTANGLEAVAALFNDSLLCLDEISEADPREVGACIYALGNGTGKQRASRTGATRPVKRWRCSVLSSGERTIDAAMAEGGKQAKAGMTVRLLDIPVNRTHGAWDNLHGMTGAQFSDAVKTAAAKYYGHAGRAFLERLAFGTRDFTGALEQLLQVPGFASAEGQHKRAARRLAIIGMAGELATEYNITGWQEGEAAEAAIALFQVWCDHRGRGPSERRQILESVRDFIDRYGSNRFTDIGTADKPSHDRYGWWREDGTGHRVYLLTPDAMKQATGGHDLKSVTRHLLDAGALLDMEQERGRTSKVHATKEGRKRLYTVNPDALEGPSDGA